MTQSQAYMLIGTLWIFLSFAAHWKDDESTSIFAALVGVFFFGAAIWVAV